MKNLVVHECVTGLSFMDVKFVNAFVGSIQNVFKTMLSAEVKIGKLSVRDSGVATAEVSGIIGISGEVQGSVILSFKEDVACRIASQFAGTELNTDSADFSDAIGELANMVAGNAKKDFTGYEANISLPSVVVGHGHKVSKPTEYPMLVFPCETSLGNFSVEVSLVSNKKPAMAGAAG